MSNLHTRGAPASAIDGTQQHVLSAKLESSYMLKQRHSLNAKTRLPFSAP
jgi:hypothetical protein